MNRREQLLGRIADEATRELASPLVDEIVWQEGKLKQTRDVIRSSTVLMPYDNGGGQKGYRQNPAYDGYNKLFKSYIASLRMYQDITGLEVDSEQEKPDKIKEMKARMVKFNIA